MRRVALGGALTRLTNSGTGCRLRQVIPRVTAADDRYVRDRVLMEGPQ